MIQPLTLTAIVKQLGLDLPKSADGAQTITAISALHEAGAGELSFLDNPKYLDMAKETQASAVFIAPENAHHLPATAIPIITPTPYMAFAQALMFMYPSVVKAGVHPTAITDETAHVDPSAEIGAYAVIGAHTTIGARTKIDAHVVIQHATVGADCIIHPGVKIGQDGFGFAEHEDHIIKIPQIGSVTIGDNVEIGANSTVDRGALGVTSIGSGTKLDNQVQIAHNVTLGENVRVCGQSGIAGSATLGHNCLIGAQSGVVGHIMVAPHTTLAAKSAITKNVTKAHQTLAGMPAVPIGQWRRQTVMVARSIAPKTKKNEK